MGAGGAETTLNVQPGDIGLSRSDNMVARAIRWAETRRYGAGSEEAYWNHAFMIVDTSGDLIEAQGNGVIRNSLTDHYVDREYTILRPPYDPGGADRAVEAMTAMVGARFGSLEIVSLALAFVFQTRLRFGLVGSHICSGAVSHALVRGGLDMGEDEEWNSPADILHIAAAQHWVWVGGEPAFRARASAT